jgi:hypothetical protein
MAHRGERSIMGFRIHDADTHAADLPCIADDVGSRADRFRPADVMMRWRSRNKSARAAVAPLLLRAGDGMRRHEPSERAGEILARECHHIPLRAARVGDGLCEARGGARSVHDVRHLSDWHREQHEIRVGKGLSIVVSDAIDHAGRKR